MKERGPCMPEIWMESPHHSNDNVWRWKVVDGYGETFAAGEDDLHAVAYKNSLDKLKEIRELEGWE